MTLFYIGLLATAAIVGFVAGWWVRDVQQSFHDGQVLEAESRE